MAWCEDRLLDSMAPQPDGARSFPIGLAEHLEPHLQRRVVPADELLMKQGDPTPGMYLILDGRATVFLEEPNGRELRLQTLMEGTVLGEISLYRDEPCTANVVTDTICEVLHLTPKAFENLCRTNPGVAAELHVFVARTLAGRVGHANRIIRALHK
jgi:SulP family sulfate permease